MKKLMLIAAFAGLGILVNAQDTNLGKPVSTFVIQEDGSILIEGDDKQESISLNGETLIIKGNNMVVHAAGNADNIIVEGDGCQIVIDSTNKIEITGSKSYVYYRKGEPDAEVSKGSAIQKIDS